MIGFLVFSLVILSVICLWILIDKRTNWKFLVWFIPVLLILVSSTYYTYTSVLGYPRIGTPKEGMYYSHYVDAPRWIYLWVITEGRVPISYRLGITNYTATDKPTQLSRSVAPFMAGQSAQGVRRKRSGAFRSGASATGTKQFQRKDNMKIQSLNL